MGQQQEKTVAEVLEARLSQSRNDLHWSVSTGVDGIIRWVGYDDSFWWDRVSGTERFRQKVGSVSGCIYTLNPDSDTVTVSAPAAQVRA